MDKAEYDRLMAQGLKKAQVFPIKKERPFVSRNQKQRLRKELRAKQDRNNRKRVRRGKEPIVHEPLKPHQYHGYIQSKGWKRKRAEAIKRAGGCCSICRSKFDLHVHHKTYERLGRERLTDLQVLCADCHAIEHEKKGVLTSLDREFRQLLG